MRNLLSSLLLATSLSTACYATTKTEPVKPVPASVDKPVKLDRAKVREALQERRKIVVERFLAYREARVYPWIRQTMPVMPQHYWFDDDGNLCAAATLLSKDWGRNAAKAVGAKDRNLQLAKVLKGEVADWILTSGLTHHEIVAIQAPSVGSDEELRPAEIQRLYALYIDVERQLKSLGDESLDQATDALMKRPDLAKQLLVGKVPGPGRYSEI